MGITCRERAEGSGERKSDKKRERDSECVRERRKAETNTHTHVEGKCKKEEVSSKEGRTSFIGESSVNSPIRRR